MHVYVYNCVCRLITHACTHTHTHTRMHTHTHTSIPSTHAAQLHKLTICCLHMCVRVPQRVSACVLATKLHTGHLTHTHTLLCAHTLLSSGQLAYHYLQVACTALHCRVSSFLRYITPGPEGRDTNVVSKGADASEGAFASPWPGQVDLLVLHCGVLTVELYSLLCTHCRAVLTVVSLIKVHCVHRPKGLRQQAQTQGSTCLSLRSHPAWALRFVFHGYAMPFCSVWWRARRQV